MKDKPQPKPAPQPAQPVDLASESVAGEEDPGAAMDLSSTTPGSAGSSDQRAGKADATQPAGPTTARPASAEPKGQR